MLALRPTFSESWYRVKNLRAKLRPTAEISRQFYRGERWYVVRDPAGNQFHRLSDAAYRFVGLLDGKRSVQEAWDLCGGQLADDAPTQPEVIQILTHLYGANLIDADVTPDSAVLLRRHKKMQERRFKQRLMQVMFPRIPFWDPDVFLKRWLPVVRLGFSRAGAMVWLVVVGLAIAAVAPEWDRLKTGAANAISPGNWLWLWVVFVFIKLIHELGHAFAVRRFGGECHELGIMFLVFIPTPYVDASQAWSFPNKWHRIFVAAAGMIVELFFAALMAFVWLNTNPTSLWNQLAYNAMLVASVTTVIFNANPLLRYDGYYILSDWLEIPNLRQKSGEYSLGLIKRHLFRVKQTTPLPPAGQRSWLLGYAVTSGIYRVFVGIMIILLVTYTVPVLGVLMALGGVATWLLVPTFKVTKYLALEPELHRKRGRAVAWTLGFATAVVVAVGLVRFPVYVEDRGIVEPARKYVVKPQTAGFVERVLVRDGQTVSAGDVILVARNADVDATVDELTAGRKATIAALNFARQQRDKYQEKIEEARLAGIDGELAHARRQQANLTVTTPIAGVLVAPRLREMQGAYVERGEEVGTVASADELRVVTLLEQKDGEVVIAADDILRGPKRDGAWHAPVEVRLAGAVGQTLVGALETILPAAQARVPHASLTHAGGEEVAADERDPQGTAAKVEQFEAKVRVPNPGLTLYPGQRATVRFRVRDEPLMWQWTRRFWQLVQNQSQTRSDLVQ